MVYKILSSWYLLKQLHMLFQHTGSAVLLGTYFLQFQIFASF